MVKEKEKEAKIADIQNGATPKSSKEGQSTSTGAEWITKRTLRPPQLPEVIVNPQVTPKPSGGKKKKRVSKTEKAERKAKREADTLHQLYKPKDSHVHLITPDLFRKLKGEGPVDSGKKQEVRPEGPSSVVASDFPRLEASSSSPWLHKSFASVISSPAPPKNVVAPDSSKQPSLTASTSSVEPQQSSSTTSTPGILRIPVTPSASTPTGNKKLSKTPLVISLDSLIVRKDKESKKDKETKAGSKLLAKRKNDRTSALIRENVKYTVGNALDGSSPGVIHRGKIRVKPKKPSKLKRCILKSRELRKNQVPTAFTFEENKSSLAPISEEEIKEVKDESPRVPAENNENAKDTKCSNSSVETPKTDAISKVETPAKVEEEAEDKDVKIFKQILNEAEEESKSKAEVPTRLVDLVKLEMHNRKFRNYCDMFVTKDFHVGVVVPMLKELYRLQNRLYQTDPIKYKTKRRFVNGLKDTLSGLKLNKVQMVVLAPDIEPNNQQGGLDERVSEIIALSKEKGVPYVFSGNRYILGKAIMQTKSPVSAIAIFNNQSVEELFGKVIEAAGELRENYQRTFDEKLQKMLSSIKNGIASSSEE